MTTSRLPWLVPAVIAVFACGGGGSGGGGGGGGGPTAPPTGPPQASATVTMGAQSFSPDQVLLAVGGTVTWNNTSGVLHNVTFSAVTGAPADIQDHSSGSNARTFGVAGAFNYTCTLHVGMQGRITVQ